VVAQCRFSEPTSVRALRLHAMLPIVEQPRSVAKGLFICAVPEEPWGHTGDTLCDAPLPFMLHVRFLSSRSDARA
jgi:hypothetical protein